MPKLYDDYYNEQLQKGTLFQDFVAEVMYTERHIPIVNFGSRKYQFQFGENLQGIEIKLDNRFRDTGNLYIEVAEKSNPNNPDFMASGIYRDDNSWLYVIGDEVTFWVFSKRWLQRAHKADIYKMTGIETSRGFLLPVYVADEMHALKFEHRKQVSP